MLLKKKKKAPKFVPAAAIQNEKKKQLSKIKEIKEKKLFPLIQCECVFLLWAAVERSWSFVALRSGTQ